MAVQTLCQGFVPRPAIATETVAGLLAPGAIKASGAGTAARTRREDVVTIKYQTLHILSQVKECE